MRYINLRFTYLLKVIKQSSRWEDEKMFRFATDTRYSVMHFCLFVNVFFVIMVASTFGDSFLVIEDRGVWDTFVWTRPVAAQCLCDGPRLSTICRRTDGTRAVQQTVYLLWWRRSIAIPIYRRLSMLVGSLVDWSLTSLFSTNTAISDTTSIHVV